jgi:hypothetical protein
MFTGISASHSTVSAGLSRNRISAVRQSKTRPHTGVEKLLDLQRTHGNAFVQRLVQRKLAVSHPGDRKADRVADAVIRDKNASSSLPRPEMKLEVARVNTLSGGSYHPALDEAVLQKQSDQVRLSTRSVGATPAIISCQETSPEETSGKQRGAGSKPRDIKNY